MKWGFWDYMLVLGHICFNAVVAGGGWLLCMGLLHYLLFGPTRLEMLLLGAFAFATLGAVHAFVCGWKRWWLARLAHKQSQEAERRGGWDRKPLP